MNAHERVLDTGVVPTAFGAGGTHPYDSALRGTAGALTLIDATSTATSTRIHLDRFLRPADDADLTVIDRAVGPVLDLGCGPGRMVRAAILAGHLALGVDISTAAVGLARDRGLPVLRRSVFDDLPSEGAWGSVLLLDGNIGIGGDPDALLERCASLVMPGGKILVETHPEPQQERTFDAIVIDARGGRSSVFPWAEVGVSALSRRARLSGLRLEGEWSCGERAFAEYVRS